MTIKFRKAIATLIAVLMIATSMPLSAFAAGPAISIDIASKTDFFAGMEYDVVATVTGVSEDAIVTDTSQKSVFVWEALTSDVKVTSSNNYSYKESGDTYTVTETATISLPNVVGLETGFKVSYPLVENTSVSKSFTTLQPITSVSIDSISSSSNSVAYIPSANRAFAEIGSNFETALTCTPAGSDDAITVTGTATKGVAVQDVTQTGFVTTLADNCVPSEFDLRISTASGVRKNTFTVVPCKKVERFKLNIGGSITEAECSEENNFPVSTIGVVQNTSVQVFPGTKSPSDANDDFTYTLQNITTGLDGPYVNDFTIDGEKCTLKNSNPGTYLLTVKTASSGSVRYNNGESILPRILEYRVQINVTKAEPIKSISLYQLDEDGNLSSNILESIDTLYTNTGNSNSYNLAPHIVTDPVKGIYTDGYYFESSDSKIAKVSETGIITAVGSGEAQIRVVSKSNPNIFASCSVKVVVGIKELKSIVAPQQTLIAGNSEQLVAVTDPLVHDEIIGWSIPEEFKDTVVHLDENTGEITALEDYDFAGNGQTSVTVPVTATTQLDSKKYTTYIKVVPADSVDDISVLVRDNAGAIMTPDESTQEFSSYVGKTYTVSAKALKEGNVEANRVIVWKVKVGSYDMLDDITGFGTVKKNTDGSYSITPDRQLVTSSTKVTYYCYASVNGTINETTPCKSFVVNVLSPVTKIFLYKPDTQISYTGANVPIGTSTDFQIETAPSGTISTDPVIVACMNPDIAEVTTDGLNVHIVGKKRGSCRIVVTTKSATTKAEFSVNVFENIDYAEVELDQTEFVFDGTEKRPNVTSVTFNGESLSPTFYSVTWQNNINAGNTASVVISGKEEYANSKKIVNFTITPKQLVDDKAEFTVDAKYPGYVPFDLPADGTGAKGKFYVRDVKRSNRELTEGVDYEIEYNDSNKVAGDATATIRGINNYQGEVVGTFKVRDSAQTFEIEPIEDVVYNGTTITPDVIVRYQGRVLEKDTDYTLEYAYGRTNVGTYTIKVAGKEYFKDSVTISFNIVPKSINGDYITIAQTKYYYTINEAGDPANETFNVRDTQRNNAGLNLNTDYTVSYVGNDRAGKAKAIFTGIGNYTDTIEAEFDVRDRALRFAVDPIPDQVYTGSQIKPEITVRYYGEVLKENIDYKITGWNANTNLGTATVAIVGMSPRFLDDEIKVNFNIVARDVSSSAPISRVEPKFDSLVQYGFYQKGDQLVNYVGDSFKVSGSAYDVNDEGVNATYKWFFSYEGGEEVELESVPNKTLTMVADGTKYFTYTYNPNELSYTIMTATGDIGSAYNFTFRCEAVDEAGNKVDATKEIVLVPKSGFSLSYAAGQSSNVPHGGETLLVAKFASSYGNEYDELTFKSTKPRIADVVKDENFAKNGIIHVIANSDEKVDSVVIKAVRRDGAESSQTVKVCYDISKAVYEGVDDTYSYTGTNIIVNPVLTYNGRDLYKDADYTLAINGKDAGIAIVTITGKGEYAGTKTITTTIAQKDISCADVTARATRDTVALTETVREATIDVAVTDAIIGRNLTKGVDYTVSYVDNTKAGTATAVITGINNYTGTRTVTFTVIDIASQFVIGAIANHAYTGTQRTPKPVVSYDGVTLVEGTDYRLEYRNNVEIGEAKVVVYGLGKYSGSQEKAFKIIPKKTTGVKVSAKTSSSITLSWTRDEKATGYYIYDVNAKKVVKKITDNATTSYKISSLTSQKAYTYKVKAYKDIYGTIYSGTYSALVYTNTLPKTPAITLTTGSKYVKATWKKNTAYTGYQYQISLKSNFSGASTVKLANTATTRTTKSLKKGKKYYVRVRAYKTIKVNGKTVTAYSAWTTKSIVCK